MALLPFFKKKEYFSAAEKVQIVAAIRAAEKETSGEIRVYVESKNPMVNPVDRAAEVFYRLKMQDTQHRNAVLLYLAMKDKELALFADEGIYQKTGTAYWQDAVKKIIATFRDQNVCNGIVQCIMQVGATLRDQFPYQPAEDKNELPDDIVFGK
ncbi:MAG: TPM domain-containing protein [Bacteroidetes bacterium]|nr:TPM domain-containing protein [Bacteroidota bacterium]